MGRQIGLFASPVDEETFLAFLRERGPMQLCVRAADSEAGLWLDQFPPYEPTRFQFFLWNQAFRWTPKLSGGAGGCVIENLDAGPVVEYCRTWMDGFLDCVGRKDRYVGGNGRVYWGARNRHVGFEKWYESIAAWVRRNGRNLSVRGQARYCLRDALRQWEERQRTAAAASGGSLVKPRRARGR